MKKTKYLLTMMILFGTFLKQAHAQVPGFNDEEAQKVAEGFLGPMTNFAMWAIPVMTGLTILCAALSWLFKSEEEKENKPFINIAKKILIVAVIAESIPVILKIFGI